MKEMGQDMLDIANKAYDDYIKQKLDGSLTETYSEKWTMLPEEKKLATIEKLKDFINRPGNKGEMGRILKRVEKFENIKFNIGILFLGVLLGISGNLVANLLDRDFLKYGFTYDVAVIMVFSFSIWYINHTFIKKTGDEIAANKTASDLIAIVDIEQETTNEQG